MGWIACVRCQKFWCDLTFALIAPVQTISHRVSCINETILNAPKHHETHQNVSLRSNGVDQVCSLWKVPTRLRGMKFCTTSARSATSFIRQPNSPKCTKIVQIARKQNFSVQWGGSGASVAKNSNVTLWHEQLHQLTRFALSVVGQKTVPNAPK